MPCRHFLRSQGIWLGLSYVTKYNRRIVMISSCITAAHFSKFFLLGCLQSSAGRETIVQIGKLGKRQSSLLKPQIRLKSVSNTQFRFCAQIKTSQWRQIFFFKWGKDILVSKPEDLLTVALKKTHSVPLKAVSQFRNYVYKLFWASSSH